MTTVIINDLSLDRKHILVFDHASDFDRADDMWDKEDKMLLDLQHTALFKGRTTWGLLRPQHHQFLLVNALNKFSALSPKDQSDEDHPLVRDLVFLLTSFIKCLEHRMDSQVNLIKFNRLDSKTMLYDLNASVNLQLDGFVKPARRKNQLSVVVDNEK